MNYKKINIQFDRNIKIFSALILIILYLDSKSIPTVF